MVSNIQGQTPTKRRVTREGSDNYRFSKKHRTEIKDNDTRGPQGFVFTEKDTTSHMASFLRIQEQATLAQINKLCKKVSHKYTHDIQPLIVAMEENDNQRCTRETQQTLIPLIITHRPHATGPFKAQLETFINSQLTLLEAEHTLLNNRLEKEILEDNDKDIITDLINANPFLVFAKNRAGNTPLHLAAYNEHLEIAQALIKAGADVNAITGGTSQTPLHLAAQEGNPEVVTALLANGANVNAPDKWGYTPLHVAAEEGQVDVIKALLQGLTKEERLECLKMKDNNGWTSLHNAARGGYVGVIKESLKGLEPKERLEYLKMASNDGRTPLHHAALKRRADVIKALTKEERLEVLKMKDNNGRTLLHFAAARGRAGVIKALLQGLEPEQRLAVLRMKDKRGWTLLHIEANRTDFDMIRVCLKKIDLEARKEFLNIFIAGVITLLWFSIFRDISFFSSNSSIFIRPTLNFSLAKLTISPDFTSYSSEYD